MQEISESFSEGGEFPAHPLGTFTLQSARYMMLTIIGGYDIFVNVVGDEVRGVSQIDTSFRNP